MLVTLSLSLSWFILLRFVVYSYFFAYILIVHIYFLFVRIYFYYFLYNFSFVNYLRLRGSFQGALKIKLSNLISLFLVFGTLTTCTLLSLLFRQRICISTFWPSFSGTAGNSKSTFPRISSAKTFVCIKLYWTRGYIEHVRSIVSPSMI